MAVWSFLTLRSWQYWNKVFCKPSETILLEKIWHLGPIVKWVILNKDKTKLHNN